LNQLDINKETSIFLLSFGFREPLNLCSHSIIINNSLTVEIALN